MTRNVMSKSVVALPKERGGLNLPEVGLKCEVLWVRQMIRMLTSTRTRKHLQFWLGGKLEVEGLQEEWFVLRERARPGARLVVVTVPYFQKWMAKVKRARAKGVLDMDGLEDLTTRQMYAEWLRLEPDPGVVLEDGSKLWGDIWRRVSSGLIRGEAYNHVYLGAHDKLGTKERGYRLMPDKYKSDTCENCKKETETVRHRYVTCAWVASLWGWLVRVLGELEESLKQAEPEEILKFHFRKGKRDCAVTWLLAEYVAFVNEEIVLKGRKAQVCELVGVLRYMRSRLRYEAVQEVGYIPDLE